MLTCGGLSLLPVLSGLAYLTGEHGKKNPVRWPYRVEDDDFSRWVHGSELLILSGASISRAAFSLSRVIREGIRLHLAGALVLFGGSYTREISRSLIELAAAHDFALMTIPWDVPLVDIEEAIARAVVHSEDAEEESGETVGGSTQLGVLLAKPALRAVLRAFSVRVLAPLATSSEARVLLPTLNAYLAAGGNVVHAAARLYVHRNTLSYRLKKIEKLLGGSLTEPERRLELALAIYVRQALGEK